MVKAGGGNNLSHGKAMSKYLAMCMHIHVGHPCAFIGSLFFASPRNFWMSDVNYCLATCLLFIYFKYAVQIVEILTKSPVKRKQPLIAVN